MRTAYADRLSQFFSEGYINLGEFEARSDAVVQAKTMSELKVVFKDLPGDMEIVKARPVRPDGSFLVTPKKKKGKRSPAVYVNFIVVLALWVTMMVMFAIGHTHTAVNLAMTLIIFVLFSSVISPSKKRRKKLHDIERGIQSE